MAYGKPYVQSPEAAAAQAEFNERKRVWVPDEKEGYIAGYVVSEDEEMGVVVMESVSEVRVAFSEAAIQRTKACLLRFLNALFRV